MKKERNFNGQAGANSRSVPDSERGANLSAFMVNADKIEVTPEMVEAGVDVIWRELGGADLGGQFSADDLVKRVYRAMCNARRATPS